MEKQIDKIAKYLLLGYDEDFVRQYYPLLDAWPDKNECKRILRQISIYSSFKDVRFVGHDTIITHDFRHDRLNIYYDENNKITNIGQG